MALNYETVINWAFEDFEQTYTQKDTILYALGLGFGQDPLNKDELKFVYEDGLKAVPSMPVVLGGSGAWLQDPRTGIDWVKVLHGEQGLQIFKPLPPEGTIIGKSRVTDVIDKGPGKGALILQERDIVDAKTGDLIARRTSTSFARGDGGCGGSGNTQPKRAPVPDTAPDIVVDLPTRPEAALIYRLSGDFNPVHADPDIARAAGFERPILHGLCTYGIGGRALISGLCGGDPDRLTGFDGRFTSPVYPGETIRTEIWDDGQAAAFRLTVLERDKIVFDFGRCTYN